MTKKNNATEPKLPPSQRLQAFLDAEKLTIAPAIARIEPAGAGRFIVDLTVQVAESK